MQEGKAVEQSCVNIFCFGIFSFVLFHAHEFKSHQEQAQRPLVLVPKPFLPVPKFPDVSEGLDGPKGPNVLFRARMKQTIIPASAKTAYNLVSFILG